MSSLNGPSALQNNMLTSKMEKFLSKKSTQMWNHKKVHNETVKFIYFKLTVTTMHDFTI